MGTNGQRVNVVAVGCLACLMVGVALYMYTCNNQPDNTGIEQQLELNTRNMERLTKMLQQTSVDTQQLMKNTDINTKILQRQQQDGLERKQHEHLLGLEVKKQEQQRQMSQQKNGQQWQEMLSFIHMDAHGLCEDIFKAEPGQGYRDKVNGYYDIVAQHNKYLASLNMTKLFEDFDGHSARYPEETYVMWSLAQLPFIKTVCETGFNAGHSAHLWLSTNPNVKVYSFDIAAFKAAKPMAQYLQDKFPNRLTVTWGDSTRTLPKFIEDNPQVKCDLMIVDGGHEYSIATQDIKNFQKMNRGSLNILFMDNYPDRRFGNKHARAWEQFKRRGELFEIFQCHYANFLQGFVFGRFLV